MTHRDVADARAWPAGDPRSLRAATAFARSGTRPAGARVYTPRPGAHEPLRDPGVSECPFFRANEGGPAGEVRAAVSAGRDRRTWEIRQLSEYTRDEMMTVAAARLLRDGQVCFVGIGLPSAACNLARLTHAPELVLIYESGTIGTRPTVLPLSIGDGELAETATCVIPLPDIFSDYLQAGRIDVGFLGAAQIDRFGNLNSTVIGPYGKPKTRLPGAGGATEIAAHASEVFIVMKATPRSFVQQLDFQTSGGHFAGPRSERRPRRRPVGHRHRRRHPETACLEPGNSHFPTVYPGIPAEDARAAIGWPLTVLPTLETHAAPTAPELSVLRALEARTAAAHREPVRLPL